MLQVGGGLPAQTLGCCSSQPAVPLADSISNGVEAQDFCSDGRLGNNPNVLDGGACTTYYTANKDANPDFPGSKWNPVRWGTGIVLHQSYTFTDVHTVIAKYVNLASQGLCPEYGRPSDVHQVDNATVIQKLVSQLPTYKEDFIRVVMFELEKDVKANLVAPQLLWPISVPNLDNPPTEFASVVTGYVNKIKYDAQQEAAPTVLEQIGTGLKYTGLLAGAGLIVWAGVKIYTSYASIKTRAA